MISDINVNHDSYKKVVIEEIHNADLSPSDKKRFLDTAVAIRPNSFTWSKSWDKGKIF
jgi:hypothetical protein